MYQQELSLNVLLDTLDIFHVNDVIIRVTVLNDALSTTLLREMIN